MNNRLANQFQNFNFNSLCHKKKIMIILTYNYLCTNYVQRIQWNSGQKVKYLRDESNCLIRKVENIKYLTSVYCITITTSFVQYREKLIIFVF